MNTQATLTDAMRRTSEAYAEGLAAVMKVIGDLPRDSGELHRRALEHRVLRLLGPTPWRLGSRTGSALLGP